MRPQIERPSHIDCTLATRLGPPVILAETDVDFGEQPFGPSEMRALLLGSGDDVPLPGGLASVIEAAKQQVRLRQPQIGLSIEHALSAECRIDGPTEQLEPPLMFACATQM
jgi:hypothetical protein